MKDRQAEPAPHSAGAQTQGGYRRAQPTAEATNDHASVKIHVGKCKGLELRDLAPEQVQALVGNWLPMVKANAKPTADDRRLIAALEWWEETHAAAATEDDNVPY